MRVEFFRGNGVVTTTYEQRAVQEIKIALTPYIDAIRKAIDELGPGAQPDQVTDLVYSEDFQKKGLAAANDLVLRMNKVMAEYAPFDEEQKAKQEQEQQYNNIIRLERDPAHRGSAGGPSTMENPKIKARGSNFDGVTPLLDDLPQGVDSVEVDFSNKNELTFKMSYEAHKMKHQLEFKYEPAPKLRETPKFHPRPTPMDDLRKPF